MDMVSALMLEKGGVQLGPAEAVGRDESVEAGLVGARDGLVLLLGGHAGPRVERAPEPGKRIQLVGSRGSHDDALADQFTHRRIRRGELRRHRLGLREGPGAFDLDPHRLATAELQASGAQLLRCAARMTVDAVAQKDPMLAKTSLAVMIRFRGP